MHKKILILSALLVLIVTVVIVGLFLKKSENEYQTNQKISDQVISTDSPIDIVLDFYNPWLEAVKSTSTDPYESGFAAKAILSEELRTQLLSTEGHAETEIDPVLCQSTIPEKITGRVVSEQDNEIRVLVMAKEKELTAQSVFTLKRHNEGWFIESILCSPGEFAPEREFSFEKEGYLLKSVPPPFNSEHWHIVFEEDGVQGHVAPLFFDEKSNCLSTDASETICSPDTFLEATKVHIYGQMLESGVAITRLEFIE